MSDAKHTPGPWHRNIKPGTKYPTVFAGRNTHVARAVVDGLPPEQVEANVDLIAAAPALLDALIEMVDAVQFMSGSADFGEDGLAHEGWLKVRPKLNVAMATLALATGKPETEGR